MHLLVRRALQTYLAEKRILSQADVESDMLKFTTQKDALFITLYLDQKVIASAGRIQCQKENSFLECIDLALLTLKDPRFSQNLQNVDELAKISIRVDVLGQNARRLLKSIDELDIKSEWIIFLSQSLGVMSIILPKMIQNDPSPQRYFELTCKKAGVDSEKLQSSDYVIYGLSTEVSSE